MLPPSSSTAQGWKACGDSLKGMSVNSKGIPERETSWYSTSKYLIGMDMEGKRACISQLINEEEGRLLA